MGQIRFANDSYSQMLKEDVDDNIRQNLSIGYRFWIMFMKVRRKWLPNSPSMKYLLSLFQQIRTLVSEDLCLMLITLSGM